MTTNSSNKPHSFFSRFEDTLKLNNHKFFFFIILVFGIILRIFCLEENGLWIDEIWSMHYSHSSKTIAEIIAACKADTHPPFFDILLHVVLSFTNDYEFTGRYVGLFFGIIGIILTQYYVFKITQSRRISLIAMALVSLNYFHIIYSFEGRFYSLVYVLSLISIAEIILFLSYKKLKHLIIFAISNIVFVYTHYYGGILLTALSLVVGFLWIIKEISIKTFAKYLAACVVIFVSFLPWLPNMLGKEVVETWIKAPNPLEFFGYFALYSGRNPIETAIHFLPLIFIHKVYKFDKKIALLLAGSILLGFLIPFTISHLFTPMLHARYTIIYLPSIIILAAIFWVKLEIISDNLKRWIAALVFLSMMIVLLVLSTATKTGHKDGWREASLILNRTEAKDIFTEHDLYLNYYLNYHGNKTSGNFDGFKKSEANEMWLLSTPYDSNKMLEEMDFQVIQEHHLSNRFVLYQAFRK